SRWEAGFRVDIPEFAGGVDGSDFVEWWASVEAVLRFKGVPEDRRVGLVATRFRGRAATWWMQLTSMRHRQGKPELTSWSNFRKYVEREFVPFNYDSLVYQQLQNLRQGSRTVDDYTNEFYRLLTRVELRESKHQLVSRYVGGLRSTVRDMLNLFRPESVSDAYQRALLVEAQVAQKSGTSAWSTRPGGAAGGTPFQPRQSAQTGSRSGQGATPSRVAGSSGTNQRTAGGGGLQLSPAAARTVAGLRCFGCGEMGHRQSVCPKTTATRALFSEEVGDFAVDGGYEGPAVFDEDTGELEEYVYGDVGTALVLRRTCLSPRGSTDSPRERHHLFLSTCTIGSKVCRFIIDSGSCENVISQEAVDKLQLATEPHPQPYTLAWIQKGTAVTVNRRALVSFSI
ncbi:F-box associated ubiquitination effector family protein, partial [Striga hermonthica]